MGSEKTVPPLSPSSSLQPCALKDLEEVFPAGRAYEQSPKGDAAHERRKKDFENDIKLGGDLYALTVTKAFEKEAKELRDRILSP